MADSNENIKTSDLFVDILIEEGCKWVFGIPGEENLDFLESMRQRQDKIRLILVRHEQAAGFMAATIGRMTGSPGVALSTLGPGTYGNSWRKQRPRCHSYLKADILNRLSPCRCDKLHDGSSLCVSWWLSGSLYHGTETN